MRTKTGIRNPALMRRLAAALIEGIPMAEIREEYSDLVGYMAKEHEQIIDGEVDRLVRKEE